MSGRASLSCWSAGAAALLLAGCAATADRVHIEVPDIPSGTDPAQEHYEARGQEPGWYLLIHDGRIDYQGNYGETKISVARPDPRPSFNGRRYVTPRLTVDLTYSRCNDAMSGRGYEHQVMVIADGKTYRGCGGQRRPQWDM